MTLGGLGMGSDPIITMQLITVTNGVGVARRRHRFCHSFVHDNQSTWKNFHSFGSEHEVIRSEHQVIRSEHQVIRSENQVIRSEHQVIRSEHKSVGLLGQWCGVEVWQRQLGI
jgi:hypothetical protein